jgi:Spy/CpxP family protein refolding chaperone
MKRLLLGSAAVLIGVLLVPAVVMAQPNNDRGRGGPGGPGGPGFFGGPFGGGGTLGLALRDEVQQELQLVDEQKDNVQSLADQMRDDVREMFSQFRDLNDEERRARFDEIRPKLEKMNSDVEAKLQKSLLPHQFERLKQIDVQSRLQRGGSYALTNGDLAKTLNITDEQKEKLEKRAAEVQQELEAQIRQLRTDARKKLLEEVLTAEQRAQLEKLMGDQFDLPEQRFDFGRFRGRGGDRDRGRGDQERSSENRSRTNESI